MKASGFHHLQTDEPLFATLVALGGNPLIQPLPLPVTDIAFQIATSTLGLANLDPSEQVKSLLSIPAEELSAKLANAPLPLNAVLDGDIVKSMPSYTSIAHFAESKEKEDPSLLLFPGSKWCKTVLTGDSQIDGMVIDVTVLSHRPDNHHDTLSKALAVAFGTTSDPKVAALTKAYGIDASNPKDKLPVIHFINDIIFAQGAKAIARAWSSSKEKAYLSHFNLPNPWDGPWKGHATHALDIVVLLGTYNEFLGAGQKACAEHMTDDFLRLAYGEEPFPPYEGDAQSKVYFADVDSEKDQSQVVKDVDTGSTKRRAILEEVTEGKPEMLDTLLGAFSGFMQGGPGLEEKWQALKK